MRLNFLFALTAAAIISSPALANNPVLTVHNRSSYSVVQFYASPSNVRSWEEDILGRDILWPDEKVRVTIADGRRACNYDLRIVFDDGDVIEDDINICDMDTYTITD